MGHGKHVVWLGLTPEPERELPPRVALLRGADVTAETARVEALILRGTQRRWLDYLVEVGALADLTTVALTSPRLAGIDPTHAGAAVVFAATANDVHHVMVGGRVIVADGAHTTIDVADALARSIGAVWA